MGIPGAEIKYFSAPFYRITNNPEQTDIKYNSIFQIHQKSYFSFIFHSFHFQNIDPLSFALLSLLCFSIVSFFN